MHKTIAWISWNVQEEEIVNGYLADDEFSKELENNLQQEAGESMGDPSLFLPMFHDPMPRVVHTPVGIYPIESCSKPSDRWDCWIGQTNFRITKGILKILMKDIDGIAAVKVLDRYAFFIGVSPMFAMKDVRINIEKALCQYTESEVLADEELLSTVNLVKEQLKEKKYWSIFASPVGKVEYIVSDNLDKKYLDGLNELLELKQILGGVILRGEHG